MLHTDSSSCKFPIAFVIQYTCSDLYHTRALQNKSSLHVSVVIMIYGNLPVKSEELYQSGAVANSAKFQICQLG